MICLRDSVYEIAALGANAARSRPVPGATVGWVARDQPCTVRARCSLPAATLFALRPYLLTDIAAGQRLRPDTVTGRERSVGDVRRARIIGGCWRVVCEPVERVSDRGGLSLEQRLAGLAVDDDEFDAHLERLGRPPSPSLRGGDVVLDGWSRI
jgi:hypothetical protein